MKNNFILRLITIILLLVLPTSCVNVFAEIKLIGNSIYTDIVTYINHYPIPSYNYNGTTLISLEDLESYGFTVWYNEYKNNFTLSRNLDIKKIVPECTFRPLEKQLTKKCTDIYTNDIDVYVGETLCTSYQTSNEDILIRVSDLAKLDNISVAWVPETNAVKVWVKDGLEMRYAPFEVRRIDDNFTYYNSCKGIDNLYISTKWGSGATMFVLTLAEIDKATEYCTMCKGKITITDVIDANGKSRLLRYKVEETALEGLKIKPYVCEENGYPTFVPYFYGLSDEVLSHCITLNTDDLSPATASEKGGLIKYKYECVHGTTYEDVLKVNCLPYE